MMGVGQVVLDGGLVLRGVGNVGGVDGVNLSPFEIIKNVPFRVPQIPYKYLRLSDMDLINGMLDDGIGRSSRNGFGSETGRVISSRNGGKYLECISCYDDCPVYKYVPPSPFDYMFTLNNIWPVTVMDVWGGF